MKTLQILKKPIITEKSYKLMEDNKYLFFVDMKANKPAIKKTFEEIFSVEVLAINILKYKAKKRRVGRFLGKKPAYKKAIIKLKPGQKLTIFKDDSALTADSKKAIPKKGFFEKLKTQFSNVKKDEKAQSPLSSQTKDDKFPMKVKDVKVKDENS